MADQGKAGKRRSPNDRVARTTLPIVAVASQKDMAVMLALHHRLLRDYARRYLRDATEDEVEDAVQRTVERLVVLEDPSFPHGLRQATQFLRAECERTQRRASLAEVPTDPQLGPLTVGPVARALDRLSPRARQTIIWAAQGMTAPQIAREDNSTPEAVRIRLHHARNRVKRFLRETSQSASAFLLALVPQRRRGAVGRIVQAVGDGVLPQSLAATMLVPLLAASAAWSSSSIPVHASSPQPGAQGPMVGSLPLKMPNASATLLATDALSRYQAPAAAHKLAPAGALPILNVGAAGETPEDMLLRAVATLPGVQSGAVVAIGTGRACGCPVLTQSLDGGVAWTSTTGPPADVTQLALPPGYPADPRIFAGVDPREAGGAPYVAAGFGQPFVPLSTLPPGQIAVSAHLDHGDPRVFSAALTGVWSIALTGVRPVVPLPHEEIDYSSGSALENVVAALATPSPLSHGPAVVAWVPALATVPGSPAPPTPNAAVMQCPVGSMCETTTTLPVAPGGLAVAGNTVVAYHQAAIYMSNDLGLTFNRVALPSDVDNVQSAALVGAGLVPWISLTRTTRGADVMRLAGGAWVDAANGDNALRTHGGSLAALDRDRVMDALTGAGYRCTAASDEHWQPRCP
jgi:DNA-directed RNA polymerase specialized sigma24 family protein